ncbi:glycosyltransferase family 2 protein [Belnapia rosea]|uniref:Cellulose synthase (UDP-forming) n=1 Tax=Belnapia rosea TaxID=938405 RepID=A0A1G7E9V7_9PROT|nr:cellulose synthase catalytic subunit [Belnapia rosea]SDE60504.1 cellulose synthase (UDP-forming) [Belnapia rosea]
MADLAWAFVPIFLIGGLAALVLPRLDPDNRYARLIGAWVTAALLLRYMWWRTAASLPPWEGSIGNVIAYAFFVIEMMSSVAGLLLIHVLSKTVNRSREADEHPPTSFPGGAPLIDVFIPTYNEKEEILYRTIVGALNQEYPRYRVWVLDDKRRPAMKALAESLGANYLTRYENSHGKAGNMNNGLKHVFALNEPPDVIAVLDADFVPTPQFLWRTCALMHDPKVVVVQTPQHFFNPDPIQLNLGGSRIVPDEQRFFFDVILASKDAHGSAFSCGTSALVRASFLKEIDGFPTESVTEDLLLSLKASGLGYVTHYLNEPLSVGLAPEGLQEYLTQRGRWCLGTMQIVRTKWGPFSIGPVPLLMRLHTMDTVLFWTVGSLIRILSLVIPILYWWTGLVVIESDLASILSHLGPYWLWCVIFLGWVSRGLNVPVIAEAMSLLVCVEAIKASIIGLFGSKNQKFKVTAKGTSRGGTVVQWNIIRWYLGLIVLTLGGILLSAVEGPIGSTPAHIEAMNLFWSVYNICTLLVACLICVERPRFRREERFDTDEPSQIVATGGIRRNARIRDLSILGCRLEVSDSGKLTENLGVYVLIQDVGYVPARVVTLRDGRYLHVEFNASPEQREAITRKLFSGRYARSVTRMSAMQLARTILHRAVT